MLEKRRENIDFFLFLSKLKIKSFYKTVNSGFFIKIIKLLFRRNLQNHFFPQSHKIVSSCKNHKNHIFLSQLKIVFKIFN